MTLAAAAGLCYLPQDAMLREYQNEIQKLKQLLEQSGGSVGDLGEHRICCHKIIYLSIG
jgi:hypothetical protein